ncbi:MAG TPA: DNA polymerase I [Candidatus Moranbacteria bacterium]|nr:DNA polymerase I [Candidatus Moranbacteria bacterium]HRZ33500.1 DNA polymerase I [Candidatus Moranbacteria bacterium]
MEKKTKLSQGGKKLILIDGNAIIHRSYHALPPLSTKKGELVNAVYGFSSTLLSVIEKFKPDYVAASFDLAGPTFRHEKFEKYKANRVKADDELYAQIPRVKEVVEKFNIPIYEKAGFEADDIIGTVAKQVENNEEQIETIIVTGDMDTLQLIDDKTKVYTMKRGLSDAVIYDEEKVFERYGLKPEQLIDYKGLRGDPSDNIPGVKGIGEKTAVDLLKKYKDINGVYKNINEIKGAVKEKLERDKSNAILSKELATITLDAPIKFDLEKSRLHDFDRDKIVKLFSELNFYSLIKRLPDSGKQIKPEYANGNTGVKDFKYFIADEKNIAEIISELKDVKEITIATEINNGILNDIALSYKTGRSAYFPIDNINPEIKNILENPAIKKIGFDLKSIFKQLSSANINLQNIYWDVMIAAYVLNPGEKITLEKLAMSELGEEIDFGKKQKIQLSLVASEEDKENAAMETCKKADYALKLKLSMEKEMARISEEQKKNKHVPGNLENVFYNIEMPLVKILDKMELEGIEINTTIFKGISEKISGTLQNLEKSIYALAGKEFNINSPQQLAEVLFVKLKLPTFNIKKGKTGFSTAADELEKLKDSHKIIKKIEEYRELFKLKTTYLDTIPKLVDKNSRIHTTFNQAVTATGRLSSAEPNLQNIPIKTELGQLLRTAFVARDGYKLISADYSQIDLRCVAHVSNDKKLIEAFHRGDDIHKLTAAEINKVTLSQVTEKMRSGAKALNFGIIYGMSAYGFSQSAGISREEAQRFINTYMEKFGDVARYMKNTREFARKNGYVETLLGRRRNIPEINSPNMQVANAAERMAINMPIQGLAADIMKIAMIGVHNEFSKNDSVKIILQIHDEIILEVKEAIAEEVAKKVKEILENIIKLEVPLVADVKIGDNWGEI